MIYFNLILKNPFSENWKLVSGKHGKIGKNKVWELNYYRTSNLLSLDFKWDFTTDHAGLQILFGLLGREIELCFYDRRHWDRELGDWSSH